MLKVFMTDSLEAKPPVEFSLARLLTRRKLSEREITQVRRLGIRRFYLPVLKSEDIEQFWGEFDAFWDQVIANFGPQHVFWRNAVSSKMQEWEYSIGYLALVLFTLTKLRPPQAGPVWILVDGIEEEDLIKAWAQKHGWEVVQPRLKARWLRRCLQEARNFLRYGYLVYIAFRKKIFSAATEDFSSWDKETILLVSLFYPWSIKNGKYTDPFFGNLHEFLSQKGKLCVYLSDLISSPNRLTKMLVKECRDTALKMPLAFLNWGAWIRILVRLFVRRIQLPESRFMGCDFSALFSWQFRSFKFPFNWHAEIFYEAVKILAKRYPLQELIFIFEGNVWERACLQAVSKSSAILTCGYSQGVMYPANLKLRMTTLERRYRPEPDRFVCTGPSAKNFFVKVGNREQDRLAFGCTLRKLPSFLSPNDRNESKNILVALDGVYHTVTLLDWLLEQEDLLQDYLVHVRGHPNVPVGEIRKQCLKEFPPNFVLSNLSLEEDIQKSRCIFYRHSSVGLQALLNGKPVVHLAIDCPLPADPLEDVSLGKWVVRNREDLKRVLEKISNLSSEEQSSFKNVRPLLEGYFASPEEGAMENFLFDKNLHEMPFRVQ